MLNEYADIRSRIASDPIWYDKYGVPRYEPFGPRLCGVYPEYVALVRIACQSCGQKFDVGFEWRQHHFEGK